MLLHGSCSIGTMLQSLRVLSMPETGFGLAVDQNCSITYGEAGRWIRLD